MEESSQIRGISMARRRVHAGAKSNDVLRSAIAGARTSRPDASSFPPRPPLSPSPLPREEVTSAYCTAQSQHAAANSVSPSINPACRPRLRQIPISFLPIPPRARAMPLSVLDCSHVGLHSHRFNVPAPRLASSFLFTAASLGLCSYVHVH